MKKLIVVVVATVVGGMLCASPIVWKGGTDTSWHTAANWDPATVPNASGAEVDLSAASGTITFSSAITVGSITFSPSSAKTLTISGSKIKMTFAGASTPSVTVGSGSTLVTSCYHGGTQGLIKLGAGTFKPLANASANNFSGLFEIRAGNATPTKDSANGHFPGGIKVLTGATFTLAGTDMYVSSQTFEIAGGTMTQAGGDYVGAFTFNNGGYLDAKNFQLYLDNGAAIKATGTGLAGSISNLYLRVNGVFSAPTTNPIHIQPFDVASGASLLFSGYILEGLNQTNPDWYMLDFRGACDPSKGANRKFLYGGMTKKGAGDLILHGSGRSTLTQATTIEAGRLVLSNNYQICLSTVTATNAASLKLSAGQTNVRVGGLSMRDGTLDLNGNTLDVGGTDGSVNMSAKVSNGTLRKISHTKQSVAGLSQSTVDVYGGSLDVGIPAPVVRYDFDDAAAPLNDSGALGKHLSWSAADAGCWHAEGGVRGGCVEMTKSGSWSRSGDAKVPSTWVYTYGGGWLEAATCAGLPTGGTQPISISAWIKPNATVITKQALAGWGRWGAEKNDAGTGDAGGFKAMGFCVSRENGQDNVLFARPWSGDWKSPSVPGLDDGNWHHVVYVYDPVFHVDRYYVDGALFLESTALPTGTFEIDTTRKFTVGGGQLYANTFMGKIDEVMVFDQALGADQVRLLASSADTTARTAALGANASVKIARDSSLGFSAAPQTLSALTGDGKLVLTDADVTLDNAAAATAATVTGSGKLTKRGAGTLTLDRATATGGKLALEQGGVTLKGGSVSSDLKSHLKGYWNFNDPANPLADASGNGLDLIPNQVVDSSIEHDVWHWRNHFEKMGGAAYFGGHNRETLICTNVPALTAALPRGKASFSIALWMKPDSTVNGQGTMFVYYHATYGDEVLHWNMLRFNGTTQLRHVFYGPDVSPTTALPSTFFNGDEFTGWHHVVYTYDGSTKVNRFYLDGVKLGDDVTGGGDPDMKTEILCIGGTRTVDSMNAPFHQNDGGAYKGYLDDVMVFDKVLTAAEVKDVMRGLFDEPAGGAAVTAAAGTTLAVDGGTVGLGSVNGAGAVSVAAGSTLVLAAGDSAPSGTLSGTGAIQVKGTASLRLPDEATFAGPVTVAANAALRCTPGVSATVADLTLAEGAAFKVDFGMSTESCWKKTGTLTLPQTATITFPSGYAGETVSAVLLEADTLTGDVSGWTIQKPNRKLVATVEKKGNKVILSMTRPGLVIFVR